MLAGRPGEWDARGARVTTVIGARPADGALRRPRRRRVQLARDHRRRVWDGERLVADATVAPIASPYSDGALRYARRCRCGDGRTRFYVEAARPDGAHDLVTFVR